VIGTPVAPVPGPSGPVITGSGPIGLLARARKRARAAGLAP
jgi:hypothetical protein